MDAVVVVGGVPAGSPVQSCTGAERAEGARALSVVLEAVALSMVLEVVALPGAAPARCSAQARAGRGEGTGGEGGYQARRGPAGRGAGGRRQAGRAGDTSPPLHRP